MALAAPPRDSLSASDTTAAIDDDLEDIYATHEKTSNGRSKSNERDFAALAILSQLEGTLLSLPAPLIDFFGLRERAP